MEAIYDYAARLNAVRAAAFARRDALTVAQKLGLAVLFAAATGIAAQVRIPVPFSPIPITGQTFAVLGTGVFLGSLFGGLSMAFYVALGAAGVPWFNGATGGLTAAFGPTGGYLVGFVIAAFIIGGVTKNFPKARGFAPMFAIMLAVDFIIIHGLGLAWLGVYLSTMKGSALSLPALFAMGTAPFIVGDVMKAAAAALLTKAVTPKS
jgi:biotin transport system substrate-specific component